MNTGNFKPVINRITCRVITKCRIDKWLWAVRIYKTRSLATEMVRSGKVKVQGQSVKPSFEVQRGMVITIPRGVVKYAYRVEEIIDKRVSAQLAKNYCSDITPESELAKLTAIESMPAAFREKGTGRPTKKQRRDLDNWKGNL